MDSQIEGQALRGDGRRADELRPIHIELNYTRYAEGSVLFTQGQTVVLCNATIEERVPSWMMGGNGERGWVTAEYAMLPRSTHTRSNRETTPQARTQEIRRLIARSLRATIDLNSLGRRQIIVDCDVLQADGGTRTASVTGGYLALALAVRKLIAAGLVSPATLLAPIAAVSVGVIDGQPMLDLCYAEDAHADVDMNVIMDGAQRLVEVQGTAERQPFDRATLNQMLDLATTGVCQLLAYGAEALRT